MRAGRWMLHEVTIVLSNPCGLKHYRRMHSLSVFLHRGGADRLCHTMILISLTWAIGLPCRGQQDPTFNTALDQGWREADYAGRGPVSIDSGVLEIRMGEQLTGVAWDRPLNQRINYEVELEAMKTDGNDFFCGLTFPYGDSACSLILGGWGGGVMGISSINGQDASANETTDYMRFEKDRWYRVRVRCTPDAIQAFLDDRPIVNLTTADKKLDIRFGVEEFLPFGIGTWQTSAKFRNLRWTSLAKPGPDQLRDGHHYIPTEVFSEKEDLALLEKFDGLRVADVSDGLDRFGYAGRTLMDSSIRPLWRDTANFTHRITGIAVTARYVPSREPVPAFETNADFDRWVSDTYRDETPEPFTVLFNSGSVLVIDEAGETDTGSIGSNNILQWKLKGCRGVITSNTARDTDEIAAQKVPLYFRKPGRGIRPGRNQLESVNMPIVCGGVQVRPGDVVVADGDGVVVVPRGVAEKVAAYASGVLKGDKSARRDAYRKLGMDPDSSIAD